MLVPAGIADSDSERFSDFGESVIVREWVFVRLGFLCRGSGSGFRWFRGRFRGGSFGGRCG